MKNSLGKLYILLLCLIALQAEDFSYTMKVDNQKPYEREGILLTVDLNQTNRDIVLLFNFDIAKSETYRFQRVDAQETDSYHSAKVHYAYLLYPLQSGEIDIRFKLLKKVTSDESVAYSFSGDRDNIKGLITTDTEVTLPPLKLKVKAVPKETALVGEFSLSYSVKQHQVKPYEPLPFQVTIKGLGCPPVLKHLLPKEGNFTRFTEQPLIVSKASRRGTQNSVTYPMALSHSKSFTLSPLVIKAFNPKTQKRYTLSVPQQHFDIAKTAPETLVDKVDSPQLLSTDWRWVKTLLGYLIVFAAGYLTAVSWRVGKSVQKRESHPMREKIHNAKDEKTLLQLLMATDSRAFATSIEKLEASLYGECKMNLKQLKEEAEKQL